MGTASDRLCLPCSRHQNFCLLDSRPLDVFPPPVGFAIQPDSADFAHGRDSASFATQPGSECPAPQHPVGHAPQLVPAPPVAPLAAPIDNIGPVSGNATSVLPLAPPPALLPQCNTSPESTQLTTSSLCLQLPQQRPVLPNSNER